MNLFQRAFANVTRKLSKTVLLTLTFFLIGNLVIIGLGVSNASESAKILARQKMRAVVTYELDYDKIWEYAESIEDEDELNKFYENYPKISMDEVSELLKDERVKTCNVLSTSMWYIDSNNSLDFVHLNNDVEENMSTGKDCYINEDGSEYCDTYKDPIFFVKGNMFPSMIEFEDGDYTLVDGRFYSQEDIDEANAVCLISENLASVNGISVGDHIGLSSGYSYYEDGSGIKDEDYDAEFEVIGIFSHNSPITPDSTNYKYTYPYENPDNMILMPTSGMYKATLSVQQKQFDYYASLDLESEYYKEENRPSMENMENNLYLGNCTILLDDPLNVDAFVEEYNDSSSQFCTLNANNDEFNRLSKPLDTLSMYAEFIVWLVVINAIVIITLVTALTLKTREYEIGVLLSLGASKLKVIAQFFTELAIVSILGFSLSVVSGSLIAKQVGNTVLEYQITASEIVDEEIGYDYSSIWDEDYSTDISLSDIVSEYEVTVSPLIIAEIYVMGLAIVFVSVIIPSFMIMRYNPKKILMNQG